MKNTCLIIVMLTLFAAPRAFASYIVTHTPYVISRTNQLDHLMNVKVTRRPASPPFPESATVTLTFPHILKHADLHSTKLLINSAEGTISVPLEVKRKGQFVTTSFSMAQKVLKTSSFTLSVAYTRIGEEDVVLSFRLDIESFLEKGKQSNKAVDGTSQ